jgi:hypothetical protein
VKVGKINWLRVSVLLICNKDLTACTQLLCHPRWFFAHHTLNDLFPPCSQISIVSLLRADAGYCLVSNWFTLFFERASGNWWVILQLPPISYINLGFPQADCFGCRLLHVGVWLNLFFNSDTGSNVFLGNVSWLSTGHYAPQDGTTYNC